VKRPAKTLSLLDAGEMSPARPVRTRRRSDDVSAGWDPPQSRAAYEIGQEVSYLVDKWQIGPSRST